MRFPFEVRVTAEMAHYRDGEPVTDDTPPAEQPDPEEGE